MAGLVHPILALLLAIAAQALLLRLRPQFNSVYVFVVIGTVVGVCLLAILFHFFTFNVALTGALLYAFLCELHIFTFTFAYSSISANLLVRLRHRPMDRNEVDSLYANDKMIQERIDGLRQNGFVEFSGGNVQGTAKGKRLAAIFNAARRFFGHQ